MPYIFSTASTSLSFVEFSKLEKNRHPKIVRKVTIRGGANVPQKRTILTPKGIPTLISDNDLDFLMVDPNFQKFVKRGFLTVGSDERDMPAALAGMQAGDKSQPKVGADFKDQVSAGAITVDR